MAVELLSCALLFVSAASYSSLSLSQRQTAGPRPIKNSDVNHKELCGGKRSGASFSYGSDC